MESHLWVCFKSVIIFPTLTSFLECFFPFNSLCPAFSCQCPKGQQGFAANNWVQLPLQSAKSFGDVQHFFLVFDFPSNVLLLSQSKKLMEGYEVPLIAVPSFRKGTFQGLLWYLAAWPFGSLDGLLHTSVKEIISDQQNFNACFVLHSSWSWLIFCVGILKEKSVIPSPPKERERMEYYLEGGGFPLNVTPIYSWWYLKALILLCMVLSIFILLSRGKVEWPIEFTVHVPAPCCNKAGTGLSHLVTSWQTRLRLISPLHFQAPFLCLFLNSLTGGASSPFCKTSINSLVVPVQKPLLAASVGLSEFIPLHLPSLLWRERS